MYKVVRIPVVAITYKLLIIRWLNCISYNLIYNEKKSKKNNFNANFMKKKLKMQIVIPLQGFQLRVEEMGKNRVSKVGLMINMRNKKVKKALDLLEGKCIIMVDWGENKIL